MLSTEAANHNAQPSVSSDPSSPTNLDAVHADKYNDPRVRVTWKLYFILLLIMIGAIAFALASVAARRTQLGETTAFWGAETIRAIQLGDHVMLYPVKGVDFEPVELTAFPGLGHLRRALLDERHYDWDTSGEQSIAARLASDTPREHVRLEFSDPTLKRFATAKIELELNTGMVGTSGAELAKSVQVKERVQTALKHQIGLLMKVHEQRYDNRAGG